MAIKKVTPKVIPIFKELRRSYGFDEVAIVPGDVTLNPDQTNIEFKVGDFTFAIPILAAAMDGVTDVNFAIQMSMKMQSSWDQARLIPNR